VGDVVLVHSSLKSMGWVEGGPETVVRGFENALGPTGTLLMPALTLEQSAGEPHDTRNSPTTIGTIPERFRTRAGTLRSVHPTHSVCGSGAQARELLSKHYLDHTPCGGYSPFHRILDIPAKIVMLGCGLYCLTSMHAIEEYVEPPYLFGEEKEYIIIDAGGARYTKRYRCHSFQKNDGRTWKQRYDRIAQLPGPPFITVGTVLEATVHVIDTQRLKAAALAKLREDPLYFVELQGSS
jgi:aminoglycoside 3-N-acetyltransferase